MGTWGLLGASSPWPERGCPRKAGSALGEETGRRGEEAAAHPKGWTVLEVSWRELRLQPPYLMTRSRQGARPAPGLQP